MPFVWFDHSAALDAPPRAGPPPWPGLPVSAEQSSAVRPTIQSDALRDAA